LSDRSEPFRYVIRNRDQKFADRFDEVFRSAGCEIVRTSFRAPQANGVAERFVRTVWSECLDWLLILNEQHLRRVLAVFVAHYDGHRPHRALGLNPVRCENSAHVGSPWNWRIDVAGGRRVRLEIRPIDIVLEPGQRVGHAFAMDPLPPPLAFFHLLFSGWVNRQQQAVIDYLLEENRVLRAAQGSRRLRLTDDQRRRLAVKGRVLGRRRLRPSPATAFCVACSTSSWTETRSTPRRFGVYCATVA
jgi:hypothetical protein